MARKRKRSRGRSNGGISRRSLLLLTSTGAVAGTGAYLSGAFDSVSGERGVGVETADEDDSNALLRVDAQDPDGNDGDAVQLFELRNQFGVELTEIEARVLHDDNPFEFDNDDERHLQTPHNLGTSEPNRSGTIEGILSCSTESREDTVKVEISVSGNGRSVDLIRPVEVICTRAFIIHITNIEKNTQGNPGQGNPGQGNPDYDVSWSATVPDDTAVDIRLSFEGNPGTSGETVVEKTGSHEDTEKLTRDGGNPDRIIAEIIVDGEVKASDSRDI